MSSRRIFTSEYKRECAELVIKHGYQVKEAAQAMNVGLSSLQKWLSQYRNELNGLTPKATAITAEQKRIQELATQVKQLKRDKELLKKASVDSSEQRNSYTKLLVCRRTFDEMYKAHIYQR